MNLPAVAGRPAGPRGCVMRPSVKVPANGKGPRKPAGPRRPSAQRAARPYAFRPWPPAVGVPAAVTVAAAGAQRPAARRAAERIFSYTGRMWGSLHRAAMRSVSTQRTPLFSPTLMRNG